MKPAAQIVEALLGDQEDPKDFLDRNSDLSAQNQVTAKLEELGLRLDEINGVEVYGMYIDPETGDVYSRHDRNDPPATSWGVSVHTTNAEQWMEDWAEYATREEAIAAAKKLHDLLWTLIPDGNELHLVDDTDPT